MEIIVLTAVRLRVDEFNQAAESAGLTTQAEQARHCGLTEGGLSKIKRGVSGPDGRAIWAILGAFPEKTFEELFTRPTLPGPVQ